MMESPRKYPRTLLEAFPHDAEHARWYEAQRIERIPWFSIGLSCAALAVFAFFKAFWAALFSLF